MKRFLVFMFMALLCLVPQVRGQSFSEKCSALGRVKLMTSCYWLSPEETRGDDVAGCRTADKRARIVWVSFAITTIGE